MNPDILLARVKTILGLEFEIEFDDILNEFIGNFVQMVNFQAKTETLPNELSFIVVETTVSRFNRRGSEGYESESFGEISISYEEYLAPYLDYIEMYKKTTNKVRFL